MIINKNNEFLNNANKCTKDPKLKNQSSFNKLFGWVTHLMAFALFPMNPDLEKISHKIFKNQAEITKNQNESEKPKQFDIISKTHIPSDFMSLERFNSELAPLLTTMQPDHWQMIDVGCGGGIQAQYFANKFPGIEKIVCLDQSGGFVQSAQENALDSRLEFVESDFHTMPFDNNSFDFVFSRLTLHYAANMEAAFKEVARIAKPGARIYICVAHPIHELFTKPSRDYWNGEETSFTWNKTVDVKHLTHTQSEYVNAISAAKLEISQMYEEGCFETESGYKVPKRLVFDLKKP